MTSRVEIWSLAGPCWRLPIRVVWFQNLAQIRVGAGARLTRKMMQAGDELVASFASKQDNTFWAERPVLEQFARKFHGDDPEDVIEWLPSRVEQVPVRPDYKAEDFILAYCASSYAVLRDTLLVERVWISIRKFMLHWLLNEHRGVDLIFAQLDALALRKNWASAAARKEHALYRAGKMQKKDFLNPKIESMVQRGVTEYFVAPEVTAWDEKRQAVYFTLECTANENWDKMVQKCEATKKFTMRGGYANWTFGTMVRQARRVAEIYARYLQETSRPATRMVESLDPGGERKRCIVVGKREAIPPADPWDARDPVFSAVEPGESQPMVSPDATLHETLPDLRSSGQDMRDTR